MSGINYSFDTNALIHFFKGNPNLQRFTDAAVSLSIVSIVEFLSFPAIEEEDKLLLAAFMEDVEVIDLTLANTALLDAITELRSAYKIKLPDAIIAATAVHKNAILITNDKHFANIPSLQILNY